MLALGWWLVPITLFHIFPLYFDAVSWRAAVSGHRRSEDRPSLDGLRRPGVMSFLWMRWIRELVSTLLPVAGVGGDVVGARLVHQRGVSGAQATASMVVDITVGSATQLVFVLVGVGLLTANRTHDAAATAWGLTAGVAMFAAAIAIFVRIQHNSMFGVLIGWAHRLAPKSWMSGFAGRAEAIDGAVVATYRRRLALSYSSALRLVGWVSGVGEVWLTMWALGKPLTRDRFLHPRKPERRRPRRGVHGAGSVGRSGGGSRPVWRAARRPAGSGAGGFSHKKGSRTGARPAGPRRLAMGGRAPFARPPGGQGELDLVMTVYCGGGML